VATRRLAVLRETTGEGVNVPVETSSLFTEVIQDHLELKARNAELADSMPIDRYITEDPFENHPLFKSEEQARLEETMDGSEPVVELHSAALPWPGEDATLENEGAALEEGLWTRSRDFDWGD
jgi:hypothetical protein